MHEAYAQHQMAYTRTVLEVTVRMPRIIDDRYKTRKKFTVLLYAGPRLVRPGDGQGEHLSLWRKAVNRRRPRQS